MSKLINKEFPSEENFLKCSNLMMKETEVINLFVYGTLMSGNRKGITYLDKAEFKGEYTLHGYALYDLGYFPGIVKDENERVKGELYTISRDMLSSIDVYEAEGSLYKRVKVQVTHKDNSVDAYVYVYNHSIAEKRKIGFCFQPWFYGVSDIISNYVWYACYGSNINRDRFMSYISGDQAGLMNAREGCSDKTPPREERQIILNHPVYFANHSSRWDNRGFAFLDMSMEAKSYGKMYLITKEQFEEIQEMEGVCYNERVLLGSEEGIPILSFTHSPRYREDVAPSSKYIEKIKEGLCDAYPDMSSVDAECYLLSRFLTDTHKRFLSYLRNQIHGATLSKIADGASISQKSIRSIVDELRGSGLIKQDGRSIRSRIGQDEPEAVYYTVPEKREVIDKVIGR